MIDLTNQVVFITGGSRGIGAATALLFAKAGADVAITYNNNRNAANIVSNKIAGLGRTCFILQCNIQSYADCKKTAVRVVKKFGKIDILVNNGGIWNEGKIGVMKPSQWKMTIDINLTGTYNMINVVFPFMKKQKYGKIINISSTAGQRGEAFHSHYAASKGGVIAFTKSLGAELMSHGIWVNCVAPGWVNTDMTSHVFKNIKQKREILRSIPRHTIPTADEIAGPILFLASSLSNNIVGEILNVNGGSVLCG
jgi:3-oxoacyl-[acyl-carrier protein] reductase